MFREPGVKWILFGFLLLLGLFLSSEGSRSYWKRKRYLKHLERKLSDLKTSNEKLSQEVARLKSDPRAIERIARSDLGLLKPGEIEYRFVVNRSTHRPVASGDRSSP